MYIEAIVLPIIIGLLRGGKLKNLINININLLWLMPLAITIEFAATIIRKNKVEPVWEILDENTLIVQLCVYMLLIIAVIYNIKEKEFILLLIGLLLNFAVIMANGGRMPVDISSIENIVSSEAITRLKSGEDIVHSVMDESTRLWFLGDVIHLMKPYPFPKSISIGDIFLIVGLFKLVYSNMFCKKKTTVL